MTARNTLHYTITRYSSKTYGYCSRPIDISLSIHISIKQKQDTLHINTALMLPSPSKMRYHDPSRPVGNVRSFHDNRAQQPKRNLKDLPFIAPPSRLDIHQCANQSPTSTKPLTTLTLSLPLAQKIHQLILASRQIENIARGLDSGMLNESQMARQMDSLDEQYSFLREDVECELETAWVNAGFLPASMPTFPAVVNKSANTPANDWAKDSYTVDKDLKRKREITDKNAKSAKRETKKRKRNIKQEVESDASGVVEESWCAPVSVQPIGISRAMIPLGWPDRAKMAAWSWLSNKSIGNMRNLGDWDEGPMSPRGTVFVV
jgi:hypothetical protein